MAEKYVASDPLPLSGRLIWIDQQGAADEFDEVHHLIHRAGGTTTSELSDSVWAAVMSPASITSAAARSLDAQGVPTLTPKEAIAEIQEALDKTEIHLRPDDPVVSVTSSPAAARVPEARVVRTAVLSGVAAPATSGFSSRRARQRRRLAIGLALLLLGLIVGFALGRATAPTNQIQSADLIGPRASVMQSG